MTVDSIRKGMKEFDIAYGTNHQRRKTDITQPEITQPLDYETEELAEEYSESQQWPPSFPEST
jgi:hypothetical protein